MFTGLVQAVGSVRSITARGKIARLCVETGSWEYGRRAQIGDSVSVAGVCLTIVKTGGKGKQARWLEFDVVRETLEKTYLGALHVGERVNLEHAATASTLLGGHLVQGHVDGVGNVVRVRRGDDWRVWIDVPTGMQRWLVSKGSVCVDGVSLTIAGLTARGFWVALIPETLEKTTLSGLRVPGVVNIEADVIAKMVARVAEHNRRAKPANRKPRNPTKPH